MTSGSADDEGGRPNNPMQVDVVLSLARRARARQVNVVDDVLARCKGVPPTRRAEVLELFLDAYRNCVREAFGRERVRGTKADAFLLAVVVHVADWPGWHVGRPAELFAELRAALTQVFETREPYHSAVRALSADPAAVNPIDVRHYLLVHDRAAYSRLGVRQNDAFKHFVRWMERRKPWLAALLGLGPALGAATTADAASTATPRRPFATTRLGQFVIVVAGPILAALSWQVARGPVSRPASATEAERQARSTTTGRDASVDVAAPVPARPTTPPAQLEAFQAGGFDWSGRVSGVHALNAVTWSGTRGVVVGAAGAILWSDDGETWRLEPQPTSHHFQDVVSGGGLFVAVGTARPGTHGGRLIAVSNDGARWSPTAWVDRSGLNGVAYGRGTFVAVGNQGGVVRSTDAETWRTVASGTGEHLIAVMFANDQFVVVGQHGTVMVSPDGLAWQTVQHRIGGTFTGVTFGHGVYLASGTEVGTDDPRAMVWTSVDLAEWTERRIDAVPQMAGVLFADDRFFAPTASGLAASDEGVTWTVVVPGTALARGGDVAWTGKRLVAVGGNGAIYVGQPRTTSSGGGDP